MNTTDEQYERVRRLAGLDIFEMTDIDLGGYKFVTPHVMISAEDVAVEVRDKMWHLWHKVDDHVYSASAENLWGAYLALIGDRLGLIVTSEPKPEPNDD